MNFKQVAIIGADRVSVSMALGLKAQSEPPRIVGYDADLAMANLAASKKAFDHVERRLDRVCRNADLVVVAVPLPVISETFAAIAPALEEGCLVTDTANLKAPVMRWAAERLPRNVFFVGGHLVLNPALAGSDPLKGVEAASSNLLKGALYCLTVSAEAPSAVIDACAGLAGMLEAIPFFIDVTEHDGLQAGVEELADVLAVALLKATVDTPGWQEMRKFAGSRFAAATAAADDAGQRHFSVFLNREHALRRLNSLLNELVHLRDLLADDDVGGLEKDFVVAGEGRARWLREQEQGMWLRERAVSTERVPGPSEQMGRMFFGEYGTRAMTKRVKGEAERSRKE